MTWTHRLAAIDANRLQSGPLPGGSAPYTTSEAFKVNKNNRATFAKRWDNHFSDETNRRTKSTLKAASTRTDPSTTISLGTARPAPRYYPWHSIVMHVSNMNQSNVPAASVSCEAGENAYDLGIALNYGHAVGSPQLLRFMTEHVEIVHNPPYKDWEVSLTCSTTSAIDILFRALCNKGDSILVEELTYSGTSEAAKGLGLNLVGIRMDEEGLMPNDLESTLHSWNQLNGSRPKLLYTIPTGQNPTGVTQTEDRRRAIYEIAEEYELLIVEDDPYYLLQLRHPSLAAASHVENCGTTLASTLPSELPPSYCSIDISGRVVRLDTASKILAPGLRCGWITGCSQLIQKFISFTELSTVAPSGPSQVLLYKLLDQTWGHAGFFEWLEQLSIQYRARLQTLLAACRRCLPSEVCNWSAPTAGMFLWVRVEWRRHPAASMRSNGDEHELVLDIEESLYSAALKQGVLISKGSWFSADVQRYNGLAFRLTFAAVGDSDLDEAVRRFGQVITTQFELE